jgi:hypothetical protein
MSVAGHRRGEIENKNASLLNLKLVIWKKRNKQPQLICLNENEFLLK